MHLKMEEPMELVVDNISAPNQAKNSVAQGRSKHIETRLHYLRDQVNKGKIENVVYL